MRSWPGRDALTNYLLVTALIATWLILTGLKIQEYLSEPTATKTTWEKSDYMPPFTICPAIKATVLDVGTDPERENDTLLDVFRDLSLEPDDMLPHLKESEENSKEFTSCKDDCLVFKRSIDYNAGRSCLTSKAKLELVFHAFLQINPWHDRDEFYSFFTYDIIFHSHPEFTGTTYGEDYEYHLSVAQRGISVLITTDRQIQVNLRRDPCIEDSNYNIRLCEQQCFFDWINCSMHDNTGSNKKRCMASDAKWYKEEASLSKFFNATDGHGACSCPKSCVTDSITVSIQPLFTNLNNNFTHVRVRVPGLMKVLRTYVRYTLSDLAADIGGYLGLLLGWSILSVCQLMPKPSKWACRRCGGGQDQSLTARSPRVSSYPAPSYRQRGGETVPRISQRPDQLKY